MKLGVVVLAPVSLPPPKGETVAHLEMELAATQQQLEAVRKDPNTDCKTKDWQAQTLQNTAEQLQQQIQIRRAQASDKTGGASVSVPAPASARLSAPAPARFSAPAPARAPALAPAPAPARASAPARAPALAPALAPAPSPAPARTPAHPLASLPVHAPTTATSLGAPSSSGPTSDGESGGGQTGGGGGTGKLVDYYG